jgi:hypothetical protein
MVAFSDWKIYVDEMMMTKRRRRLKRHVFVHWNQKEDFLPVFQTKKEVSLTVHQETAKERRKSALRIITGKQSATTTSQVSNEYPI